jgi:hypothetical protein
MLTALAAQAAQVAHVTMALNTNGITNWIAQNIVPIILAIIGVMVMAGAKRGRISDGANTIAIAMIGVILLLGAGAFMAFGNDLVRLMFT